MFKRVKAIIILTTLVFLLTSCFTEHIANTKDNIGSLVVAGKWPASTSSVSSSVSKGIHADTATIVLSMEQVDGSGSVSETITKSSGDETFEVVIEGLAVGEWKVTLTAKDSGGTTLTTASKTVTITAETTAFNAVFGPATYAELFLPASYASMAGDYTEYYEVLASLGISQRVITGYFSVSDPLGCYYEWDNTHQCVNNAGAGTHTYVYNTNNKVASSSKDGSDVYELGYNSDSRVASYNDLTGNYVSNTATVLYTDEGLLEQITKSNSYESGSSSSTGTDVYSYTYQDGNLIKLVKTQTSTSTYEGETTTYQYRDEYTYTWSNGEVVEMTGKKYQISGGEETLTTSFKRAFVSNTGGVLTWQETQYNTSDDSVYNQWNLVYTDSGEDGTIDSLVRTQTTSAGTEITATTVYQIDFTYEDGKVSQVSYNSGSCTEALTYR